MFDIGSSELLLIVVVAVVVIGPKDLPRALYKLGQIIGKGKAMTRHFRAGLDAMVREAELEELEKKWASENARIMAEHPKDAGADTGDAPQAALPSMSAADPVADDGAEALPYPGFKAEEAQQAPVEEAKPSTAAAPQSPGAGS